MAARKSDNPAIQVDSDTLAYTRTIGANLLLLIHAESDQTQAETALRMIIEATTVELVRRGIEDKSHDT